MLYVDTLQHQDDKKCEQNECSVTEMFLANLYTPFALCNYTLISVVVLHAIARSLGKNYWSDYYACNALCSHHICPHEMA